MKPDQLLRSALHPSIVPLPDEGAIPSLSGAITWLNSSPLTPNGLRGHVVLVNFWTYTCVNWLRTLPYVRAWAEKYKDGGLVVLGVHTPEFEFEKNLDNVRRESKNLRVDYPVAVDSNYAIWTAFDNHYWPALYLIDTEGHIRYHHYGEGNYEQSEMMIQQFLMRGGVTGIEDGLVSVVPQGLQVAADWGSVRSAENYVGYDRSDGFASPGDAARDQPHVYTAPARYKLNDWALVGDWTIGSNIARLNQANGRLLYHFHARDVNLVMGPPAPGSSARFRVLLDGQVPGASHGVDIDAQGSGTVSQQGTYQLIRQPKPISDRLFEIEFLDPGVETFVFTFG